MISVLLATYNGRDTLPLTLDALCRVESPPGGWKLIIIDNGSTDGSGDLIQSYSKLLPLTYIIEPQRGKNNALNTGIGVTEGELIVFTDDDVIPDAQWLIRYHRLATRYPNCDIFCGKIEPYWIQPPPNWILQCVPLGPVYTLTDPEQHEGPVGASLVWGPNMAIRRYIFQQGHRFSGSMGPDGSSYYAQGGEVEFVNRLESAGHRCWFDPTIVVRHIIPPHHMTESWILNRAIRFGRGEYRLRQTAPDREVARILGYPRWMIRALIVQLIRVAWLRIAGDRCDLFAVKWSFHYLIGQISEAKLASRFD